MRRRQYPHVGVIVYFVRRGEAGDIKIGSTKNLDQRLRKIQTDNSVKCFVMETEPGGRPRELQLHGKFDWLRLEGEWFKPHQQLLDYIASIGKPKPVYKAPPPRWEVPEREPQPVNKAAEARTRAGAAAALAALTGKKPDGDK